MGENGREMGHGGGARGEWEGMEDEGNETFYFMPFFFLTCYLVFHLFCK